MTTRLTLDAAALADFITSTRRLCALARMVDDFAELRAVADQVERALDSAAVNGANPPQGIPPHEKPRNCITHSEYHAWCAACVARTEVQ